MRKIEIEAKKAFYAGQKFAKSNVSIQVSEFSEIGKVSKYYLHGNLIAEYFHNTGLLKINDAGWQTVTTKSRLNSLLPSGSYIHQKNHIWYLNGEEFTSSKSIQIPQ